MPSAGGGQLRSGECAMLVGECLCDTWMRTLLRYRACPDRTRANLSDADCRRSHAGFGSPEEAKMIPITFSRTSISVVALMGLLAFSAVGQAKDYLKGDPIGPSEQRWRHLDAERSRRLQVDDELEFDGFHDQQIGRLGALESAAGLDADLVITAGRRVAVEHDRHALEAGRG
jgi:hypothetical protein